MSFYQLYINFLILLKILFILLSLMHFHYKRNHHIKQQEETDYWKSRIEFIFIVCMSLLLIYLFSPACTSSTLVTGETKILLFLFGFILLITAKWENFIYTSQWFQDLQQSLR
jgi:uncharacterized membrane protein